MQQGPQRLFSELLVSSKVKNYSLKMKVFWTQLWPNLQHSYNNQITKSQLPSKKAGAFEGPRGSHPFSLLVLGGPMVKLV